VLVPSEFTNAAKSFSDLAAKKSIEN